jgi:hypothetical protein
MFKGPELYSTLCICMCSTNSCVSMYIPRFIENSSVSYRDVALYALGVGAAGADPCDPSELPFVYHPDGQSSIKVLSTVIWDMTNS